MRKNTIWFYSLLLLAVSALFVSCSKDEDLIPEITIPEGSTDYFTSSINFDNNAGEKTITFTSNVEWQVSVAETRDGISWCTVTPSYGEKGTNTVKISVTDNTTYDDRNAVIRFIYGDSTKSVFVNQKQLDALTLTANRFEVPTSGGYVELDVKANIDYTVTIADDCKQWIHQKNNAKTRGLKTTNLKFWVDASEECSKREGTIEIKSGEKSEFINIYQAGDSVLTLTKKTFNLNSSEQDITINVKSNFDYSVDLPNVDWIKEDTKQTRAMSTHTIKLHISDNDTYEDRQAVLYFRDNNSSRSETVTINQSQNNAVLLDQKEFEFDENGGEFTINVQSNVNYVVSIDREWVSENKESTRGLVSSSHTFSVSKMDSHSDRNCTIKLTDKKSGTTEIIYIKQKNLLYLTNTDLYMMLDSSNSLNSSCVNKTSQSLKWESCNPDIVSVDRDGKLESFSSVGYATITVTSEDMQHKDSCVVYVRSITACVSMQEQDGE